MQKSAQMAKRAASTASDQPSEAIACVESGELEPGSDPPRGQAIPTAVEQTKLELAKEAHIALK